MSAFTTETVSTFTAYYSEKLAQGLATIPWSRADALADKIVSVMARGRQVFAFGNGGSYAIASAFLLDLRESVPKKYRKLVAPPLSIQDIQGIAHASGFDSLFAHVINTDAQAGDLVILVSSSSASINILAAAEECSRARVRWALITNSYSSLAESAEVSVGVEIDDQQPGEDLSLVVLRSIARVSGDLIKKAEAQGLRNVRRLPGKGRVRQRAQPVITRLIEFVNSLDLHWLDDCAEKIVVAFLNGHRVFIYAPSGGALSLVAQHIAHNLQWDALMLVNAPGDGPTRMQIQVSSIGNPAHVTGVSNDRSGHLFHGRQLMFEGKDHDLMILLDINPSSPSTCAILGGVKDAGIDCYTFVTPSCTELQGSAPAVKCLGASFSEKWAYEAASQVVGHLLGRLVRGRLHARGRGRERPVDFDQLMRRQLKEIENKAPGTRDLNVRLGLPPDSTDHK
jgi:D-sedoheptulose 7-phosphate isomerase